MNPKLENIVRHTPLPVAGLAFGITGLGGLFAEFGQGAWAKPVFGVLGAALLIIVLLKALFLPQNLKANLQHPDRKSTRLNSSHIATSRMPSSA